MIKAKDLNRQLSFPSFVKSVVFGPSFSELRVFDTSLVVELGKLEVGEFPNTPDRGNMG
jgi:hypothetical protein